METARAMPESAKVKGTVDLAEREKEAEKKVADGEKAKTDRKVFMRRQKERMSQQFEQMIKEREEVVKKQEAVQAKEKELQQKIRVSMEQHVKETAPDRGKEQRERKQINDFLSQEEVQQILYRFEPAMKQMFKFYASQDKKDVGFNLAKAMNSMTMRELIRFAYQQLIIPTLLQPEDIVQIFRQLIREKNEEVQSQMHDKEDNYLVDQNFAQIIDFEQFKKVLVRIATLAAAENHAGGINSKLDQEAALKKKTKKNKDLKLSEEALAKEDAFLDKMNGEESSAAKKRRLPSISKDATIASQRSRSQMKNAGNLPKSNTTNPTQESPQKGGAPMVNALTNSLRMSKEVKILRALEEKEQLSTHLLAQSKIDKDRKVRKEFNLSLIQPKTIEALLRFLELEPEETAKSLEAKLNQHRIEIQGQKPNRVKKQMKNNKLEDYIREMPGEEGENTMYGNRVGASQMEGNPEDGEVMQREDTVAQDEQ
ncbi:hypothetical protein FGO68_gene7502 [Halteria grandinella]|uniref:Uncharacterized protein n=1 Tax=Halteria grandinella TaxID=5974 RepID=A0A8J8SWL2_HALGN|nr:hypothetical protein FGO68_gene7502 [Halteria grandinella]